MRHFPRRAVESAPASQESLGHAEGSCPYIVHLPHKSRRLAFPFSAGRGRPGSGSWAEARHPDESLRGEPLRAVYAVHMQWNVVIYWVLVGATHAVRMPASAPPLAGENIRP
jgi:hypothetical protein